MKTVAGHPVNILQDVLVLDNLSTLEKVIVIRHTGTRYQAALRRMS